LVNIKQQSRYISLIAEECQKIGMTERINVNVVFKQLGIYDRVRIKLALFHFKKKCLLEKHANKLIEFKEDK